MSFLRDISKVPYFKLGKFHLMVNEGVVLGHKISSEGIEVNKAKI